MATNSPQSQVDRQSLQATLIQIRERAQNIEQLSERELAPAEYFNRFLDEVIHAMGASGGAVWIQTSDGCLNLLAHSGKTSQETVKKLRSWDEHENLLRSAIRESSCQISTPLSGHSGNEKSNPTEHLILLSPLKNADSSLGIVEIFQRPNNSRDTQVGYMRFLDQMTRLASRYLSNRKLRDLQDKQTIWKIADEFSQLVHVSLDVQETTYDIANELRRLLQAERVTVTICEKKKNRVAAISNLSSLDHRSNTIKQLIRLGNLASESGEEVDFQGDFEDLNKQQVKVIQEYISESDSGTIRILPLYNERAENEKGETIRQVIGTVILEWKQNHAVNPEIDARLSVLHKHSSLALARALEHEDLFLIPLLKVVGQLHSVKRVMRCPKWLGIIIFTAAALLAFTFYQIDFNVFSLGSLSPAHQRDIFAPDNGVVESLLVSNGDTVQKGQVLAVLKNQELVMQKESIEGELLSTRKKLSSAKLSLLGNRKSTPAELDQLHAQVKQLKQAETSLLKQLSLYEQKLDKLAVRSPISGEVITWDVNQLLNNRPVSRGQRILTVADNTDTWQVELKLKEDELGYLQNAMRESDSDIKVSFTMATHPGKVIEGVLSEVQNQASFDKDGKRYIKVKVNVDSNELPSLYTGAAIQAKIHCGQKSIGYVWFHDVLEFIENKVLFML